METKKIIKSKTLWFNGLSIVGIVLTEALASPEIKMMLGSYTPALMVAGAAVNGILRKYTTEPLGDGKPTPKQDTNTTKDI